MKEVIASLSDQRHTWLVALQEYLRIPSVSADPARHGAMEECAHFTAKLLRQAGLHEVTVHTTAGHPLVTAEWLEAPGQPTYLVYGHYDVQPVDPLDEWERDPFDPHIRNERLVARGAADDKGQLFMHIKAVESILKQHGRLPVNLRFLLEGEEEIGSAHLPAFLRAQREKWPCDGALVSDSSMWGEGRPAIMTGLRGLVCLEVTLTGPNRDLHSGIYGGAVANPIEILARVLASVKDEAGRIQIPGYYDRVRPLTAEEEEVMRRVPFDREAYLHELGVKTDWGEAGYTIPERTWCRPTFEINGLWGGFTGQGSKTVLPARASAKISCRLVADQDPEEMVALVENYLRNTIPESVTITVHRFPGGGHPLVVPLFLPMIDAARRALRESFQQEPLILREGGSIPVVADFKHIFGVDTLLVGFALPDARTHSPNETLHLPTFFTGIESLVRLYYYLGESA